MTTALFFYHFSFANGACQGPRARCSLSYGLLHPDRLVKFFVLLVGNVIPTSIWIIQPRYLRAQEILGTVICVVAGFVVVQSVRERRLRANPLPLVLIVFALMFDLMIAQAHVGEALSAAGQNRFTMPNTILLVGIVVCVGSRSELAKRREAEPETSVAAESCPWWDGRYF